MLTVASAVPSVDSRSESREIERKIVEGCEKYTTVPVLASEPCVSVSGCSTLYRWKPLKAKRKEYSIKSVLE